MPVSSRFLVSSRPADAARVAQAAAFAFGAAAEPIAAAITRYAYALGSHAGGQYWFAVRRELIVRRLRIDVAPDASAIAPARQPAF